MEGDKEWTESGVYIVWLPYLYFKIKKNIHFYFNFFYVYLLPDVVRKCQVMMVCHENHGIIKSFNFIVIKYLRVCALSEHNLKKVYKSSETICKINVSVCKTDKSKDKYC